jgi:hypothetical protein
VAKDLYAYCLVRTDLPSLGAGKAIAHGMHAGNQMTWLEVAVPLMKGEAPNEDVILWSNQAKGFGTTIALGDKNQLDLKTVQAVVDAAKKMGFVADVVVDTSYPYLVDKEIVPLMNPAVHSEGYPPIPGPPGFMVCFRKEITTAYVFGDKAELEVLLRRFGLYPND